MSRIPALAIVLGATLALTACEDKTAPAPASSAKPAAAAASAARPAATTTGQPAVAAPAEAKAAGGKVATAATLTPEQAKEVIDGMNELCPDTWCEGDFDWKFKTLTCQPDKCKLTFTATKHEAKQGKDGTIEIAYKGEILGADGVETDAWSEALNKAIMDWEMKNR